MRGAGPSRARRRRRGVGCSQVHVHDPSTTRPQAMDEWDALRKRLKTLGGSTTAVSLVNLRQDAGMLATTAGATPYVLSHPDVLFTLRRSLPRPEDGASSRGVG
mmetsp:Transcript_42090/g.139887  ORF Transcript_42090/g.139887 Transcript_42090/m.139887 type:complete len:104 (+) Transcript_42090:676-987(+)